MIGFNNRLRKVVMDISDLKVLREGTDMALDSVFDAAERLAELEAKAELYRIEYWHKSKADKDGRWRWHMRARKTEKVAYGEGHKRKDALLKFLGNAFPLVEIVRIEEGEANV